MVYVFGEGVFIFGQHSTTLFVSRDTHQIKIPLTTSIKYQFRYVIWYALR